jgi:hypothetical protein
VTGYSRHHHHAGNKAAARNQHYCLTAGFSCFLQLCYEFRVRRHLLEQPSSPSACGAACHRRRPVGELAFVVLVVADAIRYRLDGGEPLCSLAGGVVRRAVTARCSRLLPSDEDSYNPPRKRTPR